MSIESALNNSRVIKGITFTLIATMILLSMMAGAAQEHSHKKTDQNIVDVAVENGNFNTLAEVK